jgi:hypothetical protein
MTDAECIAIELADAYGLDPVRFMCASAFLSAVGKALEVMRPDEIVRGVLDQGGLAGLVNPYGGVFARIAKLAEEQAWRTRLTDDAAELARLEMVDRAAHRGETLADLVANEQLYGDEAEDTVAAEFADEEIRAIALDALRGRLQ